MAIRLFKVVGLAALVVFPAHSQNLICTGPRSGHYNLLPVHHRDDVDQRTKLNLLLAQKQVSREDVIRELAIDVDRM